MEIDRNVSLLAKQRDFISNTLGAKKWDVLLGERSRPWRDSTGSWRHGGGSGSNIFR